MQEKLTRDPSLTQERYAGRTLLHAASAAGSLTIVELLLRLGADPNATDGGGHTPLYSAWAMSARLREAEMWSARWFEAEQRWTRATA